MPARAARSSMSCSAPAWTWTKAWRSSSTAAYHGHDCIHMLALLSTPSSAFNRLNAARFRAPRAARLLYPVLRTGRNAALRLLGRSKIRKQAA